MPSPPPPFRPPAQLQLQHSAQQRVRVQGEVDVRAAAGLRGHHAGVGGGGPRGTCSAAAGLLSHRQQRGRLVWRPPLSSLAHKPPFAAAPPAPPRPPPAGGLDHASGTVQQRRRGGRHARQVGTAQRRRPACPLEGPPHTLEARASPVPRPTTPLGCSYAYDGRRRMRWHVNNHPYGEHWAAGDTIGCCLDLDGGTMRFLRNGKDLVRGGASQAPRPRNCVGVTAPWVEAGGSGAGGARHGF
jgi:hypothetical protein